ncbi:Ada metal-binding domain-containing protein [Brevibacillus massiliensis]|uniref:Ada metal-binding domain-containing protein n=1 Tax=Brevibacillus massiliensis TaxID=1118054 RepID=UPI000305989A
MINCDSRYDSLFFYAVRTTKICCRPSCESKTPSRRNVCFFHSLEAAYHKGFRA